MWTENFQKYKLNSEKAEEPDQTANVRWLMEKAREFQKNIYCCFNNYTKAFEYVDTYWKILGVMGVPDPLTCLLRNLYAGQEATVRTRYETTGSKMEKE